MHLPSFALGWVAGWCLICSSWAYVPLPVRLSISPRPPPLPEYIVCAALLRQPYRVCAAAGHATYADAHVVRKELRLMVSTYEPYGPYPAFEYCLVLPEEVVSREQAGWQVIVEDFFGWGVMMRRGGFDAPDNPAPGAADRLAVERDPRA